MAGSRFVLGDINISEFTRKSQMSEGVLVVDAAVDNSSQKISASLKATFWKLGKTHCVLRSTKALIKQKDGRWLKTVIMHVRLRDNPSEPDPSGLLLGNDTFEELAHMPVGETRVAVLNSKVQGALAQALVQLQYAFALVGRVPTVQVEQFIAEEKGGYWQEGAFLKIGVSDIAARL